MFIKKTGRFKRIKDGREQFWAGTLVAQTGGKLTWWRGQRVKSKPQTASESIKKGSINKYPLTLKGK